MSPSMHGVSASERMLEHALYIHFFPSLKIIWFSPLLSLHKSVVAFKGSTVTARLEGTGHAG